jgi:outer membrane receptor protein involved in Fe transport
MKFLRSARRLRLWFASFLASALPALAQTVPAPTATTPADTVILTPFTVSTDRDNGYAATETLAGTRLRTELRDVAASMSVLTPELLRDLGANSIDEAIAFMPSSDKVVVDGNATGSANTANAPTTATSRVSSTRPASAPPGSLQTQRPVSTFSPFANISSTAPSLRPWLMPRISSRP